MSKLIYLSSPYSSDEFEVMYHRFNEICRISAHLMREGLFVFSPIAHCHDIARWGLPTDYEFWKEYNHEMLMRCDELYVIMMEGWIDSRGVGGEIIDATENNKPITYISDDLDQFQIKGESNVEKSD